MRLTISRLTGPAAIAAASVLVLAACSDDAEGTDSTEDETPAVEETEDVEETPEEEEPTDAAEEETEAEEAEVEDDAEADEDASASAEGVPEWANPVTTGGESMGTVELGDVTVEVFQVAMDQATRSSIWADPETEEPIVAEGDDVVVLNYVFTNSGEPINLSYGLIEAGLRYDTWEYMQQPSVSDSELLETHGVNTNAVNSDSLGEDAFVLGSGEQYSIGEVMLHQPGEDYTVVASYYPRDEAGERDGEDVSGELTGTME